MLLILLPWFDGVDSIALLLQSLLQDSLYGTLLPSYILNYVAQAGLKLVILLPLPSKSSRPTVGLIIFPLYGVCGVILVG